MADKVVVNVGNSRISAALFRRGVLADFWHHETADVGAAAAEIAGRGKGSRVAVASVVPDAGNALVERLSARGQAVRLIESSEQKLIAGTYETMGSDRVANIAAGWKLFGKDCPVIVIDLGTATTLTAVSAYGVFAGGLITLGLGRTFSALHREAAQLPQVDIERNRPHPSPLAFDTETAIGSGTILAHVGMVEYWIKLSARSLGAQPVVVATGGWSAILSSYTRAIEHVDPYLTLKGIYLLAEASSEAAAGPADQG